MNIFSIDKRNALKRQVLDPNASSLHRIGFEGKKPVVQRAHAEKRLRNSGQKRWYSFAYIQELLADVFNIYNTH